MMPTRRSPVPSSHAPSPVDPLAHERALLGPLEVFELTGRSMADAHGSLGERLGEVVREIAARRWAKTSPKKRAGQIRIARRVRAACASHGRGKSAAKSLATEAIVAALAEYQAAVAAWGEGCQLERVLVDAEEVDGTPITPLDLAYWLQDDNTGCQTGLVRVARSEVLVWHTEEDTIGDFDRSRVACFRVGQRQWFTFLYPTLLPGPAFGWQADRFQAIDSLHVRRSADDAGLLSGVISWLSWRLGNEVDTAELVAACLPSIDACAINVVRREGDAVTAEIIQFGQNAVAARSLPKPAGRFCVQVNAMEPAPAKLKRLEGLAASERGRYENRIARATEKLSQREAPWTAQALVEMLACRRGGGYAMANRDVKSYCVGRFTSDAFELYVQSGAALKGDRYQPQWSYRV